MGLSQRPKVHTLADGSKIWEHDYGSFTVKDYIPQNNLNGAINNYSFCAPLLIVLEEKRLSPDEAAAFAKDSGLSEIAAGKDTGILFVYPSKGDWSSADESVYVDLFAKIKLGPDYADGILEDKNFFTGELQGYYIRGTKFHSYVYGFGASADYAAKHLLKSVQGEFLWGPGEITPAAVSMERLSVIPEIERTDIPVISVGNSSEINAAFESCDSKLIKDKADYRSDYYSFVYGSQMWCGVISKEVLPEDLGMTEEAGSISVAVSPENEAFAGQEQHEVGYFAYYNKDAFDNGPAPLVIGFHGMGDSSMFLAYVSGWYKVAHKYGFVFVSFENHQNMPAEEAMEALEELKKRYKVDEHRIYAVGFSMGCGKTWDLFEKFPDHFAGMAPACALFPVYSHPFGKEIDVSKINKTVPVPIFYSGGDKSHVSELPFQSWWAVERLRYAMEVNKCIKKFDFDFEHQDEWDDPMMAVRGDRVERIHDESRDAYINVHYFDSEDGVCRTVFAAVEGQGHEYRQHTADLAWQFISQFTR